MTFEEYFPLLMFPALLMFLLSGFPVAFILSGTALLFGVTGYYLDIFYLDDLGFIPSRIFGIVQNITLLAVPLFVFMGMMLEKSGLAKELLKSVSDLFKQQKSSLAFAVVLVGALLAASTGIVGATVVTMGVLSLPTMLEQGYNKRIACGTIAASGTLGQIIPPSIVLVLLGDMMNVDVGDLFAGAILPGILLVSMYLLYIGAISKWGKIKTKDSAAVITNNNEAASLRDLWVAIIPPLLLIVLVLGTILTGLASPTEASACGAAGAILIAWFKRKLSWSKLLDTAKDTTTTTAMVFMILIGAQFFGVVFRGLSGDDTIAMIIDEMNAHPNLILFMLMAVLFGLGFFLDFLEICFIIIPIILPITLDLGFNSLWLAILIAVNLQTSFLTPPFGFSLFYLKGVAPKSIKTTDIYRGVIPFVAIQMLLLLVIALFPDLVLWLPTTLFKS